MNFPSAEETVDSDCKVLQYETQRENTFWFLSVVSSKLSYHLSLVHDQNNRQ